MWIGNAIKIALDQIYVQFVLQLLISEFIFFFRKEKRSSSKVRYVLSLVVLFLGGWAWTELIASYAMWNSMLYMVIYPGFAVLTYLWIYFNYEGTPMEDLFVVAGGYATEHMAFCLTRIVMFFLDMIFGIQVGFYDMYNATESSLLFLFGTKILPYVVAAWLIYHLIVKKNVDKLEFRQSDYKVVALSLVLMVSSVLLSQCYNQEEYWDTLVGAFVCPMYGFICCLLVLIMVYYILWTQKMQFEQESMEQLIRISENQQKSTKEAIDIINIKCHDLKHQIHALGAMNDEQERKDYIEEIKGAVSIYDAVYHTGNEALDYVLREKTLISGEYDIKFSAMADGTLLNFMHAADIYALMSNAIDNAFESVIKEPVEKRIVSLQIRKQGKMILIHLENWCSKEPEFLNGLPLTSKKDKSNHGFGVRSIRYITEKYGGEVNMRAQDKCFYLDVLFPFTTE